MNHRKLGNTGITVAEIGFGAWGIGGAAARAPAYGPTDDRTSMLALRRAFDLGVNFFDTSDLYGFGHSEWLLGKTFKDVRHQVVVATKVGFVGGEETQDFSPAHIRRSLDASLERLNTDYVDLYQLHSPSIDVLEQDDRVLSVMRALQDEGKVRAFGISVRSPGDGLTAVAKFGFKVVQVNFNLVDQRAVENGLFELCDQQDVGVIVRTPLCFGFLSGTFNANATFDSSDHRSGWSSGQIDRWADAHRLFHAALLEHSRQTPSQAALRFCLSYPSVSVVIPGMLKVAEVEENITASQMGGFSETELAGLEQIYRDNNFYVGRV